MYSKPFDVTYGIKLLAGSSFALINFNLNLLQALYRQELIWFRYKNSVITKLL